jgi:hypothetical protein
VVPAPVRLAPNLSADFLLGLAVTTLLSTAGPTLTFVCTERPSLAWRDRRLPAVRSGEPTSPLHRPPATGDAHPAPGPAPAYSIAPPAARRLPVS